MDWGWAGMGFSAWILGLGLSISDIISDFQKLIVTESWHKLVENIEVIILCRGRIIPRIIFQIKFIFSVNFMMKIKAAQGHFLS